MESISSSNGNSFDFHLVSEPTKLEKAANYANSGNTEVAKKLYVELLTDEDCEPQDHLAALTQFVKLTKIQDDRSFMAVKLGIMTTQGDQSFIDEFDANFRDISFNVKAKLLATNSKLITQYSENMDAIRSMSFFEQIFNTNPDLNDIGYNTIQYKRHLIIASELGDAKASSRLANIFANRSGHESSAPALSYAIKAQSQGNEEALFNLGIQASQDSTCYVGENETWARYYHNLADQCLTTALRDYKRLNASAPLVKLHYYCYFSRNADEKVNLGLTYIHRSADTESKLDLGEWFLRHSSSIFSNGNENDHAKKLLEGVNQVPDKYKKMKALFESISQPINYDAL